MHLKLSRERQERTQLCALAAVAGLSNGSRPVSTTPKGYNSGTRQVHPAPHQIRSTLMLWTIVSVIGGIGVFAGVILFVALLERRWGRGHLGVKRSTEHHLSEVEVTSYRNRL
jgi:hypothetical protein